MTTTRTAWIAIVAAGLMLVAPALAEETAAPQGDDVARATALLDEGKIDEARPLFETALESDPENADAHVGIARIEIAYGEWDLAIDHLIPVLEKHPEHASANLYNGIALYYKALKAIDDQKISGYVASLFSDAQASCEIAAKVDPENIEAYQYLGLVFYYQNDFAGAIEAFERGLKVKPDDAFSHFQIGESYQVQSEWDSAIPHYKRAIECEPQYAEAYRKLGLCEEFLKQLDAAGEAYGKAIEIAPGYFEPYKDLWRVYADVEPEKGVATLAAIAETHPDLYTLQWYLGHFKNKAGDSEGALAAFDKCLEISPVSTDVHLEKGRIHTQQGDLVAATDEYWTGFHATKAAAEEQGAPFDIEKNKFFTALLDMTSSYGSQQKFEPAEQLLLKLAEAAPSYGFVWSNLGLVYRDWGKDKESLDAYAKAAELLPYDAQVLNDYAVVLDYSFDRRDEAYVLYKKAVEISENGDAMENLARYYILNGLYEEAVRITERGLRIEPDRMMFIRYRDNALRKLGRLGADETAGTR